jgi:uncharacterized protein YndB with AHSA1/START domain
MSAPNLVYVTTIRTTADQLWKALTDPDFIRQYWFGRCNTSTWKEGDAIESRSPEGELEWQGKILKSIPGQEVIFTFESLNMEKAEPPSRVAFKIEPMAEVMQLTIIHDEFPEVSAVRDRVSNGWPSIIEGIKGLLETGDARALKSSCSAA